MSKNDIKNIFRKENTSQKLPTDTRKQCWQSSQRIVAWRLKSSSMCASYEKKILFLKQMFLQKCSYGNVDCLIDNRSEQVSERGENFSLKEQKW